MIPFTILFGIILFLCRNKISFFFKKIKKNDILYDENHIQERKNELLLSNRNAKLYGLPDIEIICHKRTTLNKAISNFEANFKKTLSLEEIHNLRISITDILADIQENWNPKHLNEQIELLKKRNEN